MDRVPNFVIQGNLHIHGGEFRFHGPVHMHRNSQVLPTYTFLFSENYYIDRTYVYRRDFIYIDVAIHRYMLLGLC